ncbi:phosphotransferase family protein [Crossiella sp. CA198]|uniref:phosphotransferase family protein n=1 Tax=Crossiella sp. CA198 TaxID=3455607 RepID=UPI003F8D5B05
MTVSPQDARLDHACATAGLRPTTPPRRIVSHSNDTWLIEDEWRGPVVLRVSWRGDVARIGREVAVTRRLPAAIRRPEVLDHGTLFLHGSQLAYSLTRLVPGRPLDECWPALTEGQRRSAVSQLAAMLRELHEWTPPPDLTALLLERPYHPENRITGLLGADLNPLPVARAAELAEHASGLPHVEPGLLRAAAELLHRLAPFGQPVDDPAAHGLMHGDLQLGNLLWSESGELTMLDLEWVRFGPPLLDLQRLCARADTDHLVGADTHPTVLRWLAADYPAAFAGPHPAARLRLYTLAYAIRDLIVHPPDREADPALHRLRRLVEDSWPVPGAWPDSLERH